MGWEIRMNAVTCCATHLFHFFSLALSCTAAVVASSLCSIFLRSMLLLLFFGSLLGCAGFDLAVYSFPCSFSACLFLLLAPSCHELLNPLHHRGVPTSSHTLVHTTAISIPNDGGLFSSFMAPKTLKPSCQRWGRPIFAVCCSGGVDRDLRRLQSVSKNVLSKTRQVCLALPWRGVSSPTQ